MSADEQAYIEQLAQLRTEELLAQTVSTMISLGFTRIAGLPGRPELQDLAQAQLAIETVVALRPVVERVLPPQSVQQLRGAIAELQLAFADAAGQPAPGGAPPGPQAGGPSAGAGQTAPGARSPSPASPPPPPPRQDPPRPKIWTPRGDV